MQELFMQEPAIPILVVLIFMFFLYRIIKIIVLKQDYSLLKLLFGGYSESSDKNTTETLLEDYKNIRPNTFYTWQKTTDNSDESIVGCELLADLNGDFCLATSIKNVPEEFKFFINSCFLDTYLKTTDFQYTSFNPLLLQKKYAKTDIRPFIINDKMAIKVSSKTYIQDDLHDSCIYLYIGKFNVLTFYAYSPEEEKRIAINKEIKQFILDTRQQYLEIL